MNCRRCGNEDTNNLVMFKKYPEAGFQYICPKCQKDLENMDEEELNKHIFLSE